MKYSIAFICTALLLTSCGSNNEGISTSQETLNIIDGPQGNIHSPTPSNNTLSGKDISNIDFGIDTEQLIDNY